MSLPISSPVLPVLLCIGWFWTGLQTRKLGEGEGRGSKAAGSPNSHWSFGKFFLSLIFCFLLCKEDCGIPPLRSGPAVRSNGGPCAHSPLKEDQCHGNYSSLQANYEGSSWEFSTIEEQAQLSCKLTGMYTTSIAPTVDQPMKTEEKWQLIRKEFSLWFHTV